MVAVCGWCDVSGAKGRLRGLGVGQGRSLGAGVVGGSRPVGRLGVMGAFGLARPSKPLHKFLADFSLDFLRVRRILFECRTLSGSNLIKITARGWRRDSGPKAICECEVKDAEPHLTTTTTYDPDVPYLRRTASGLELRVGPATLNLGGEYQLMLGLTDDDINRLFLEIHPELRDSLQPVFVDEKPAPPVRVRLKRPILPATRQ